MPVDGRVHGAPQLLNRGMGSEEVRGLSLRLEGLSLNPGPMMSASTASSVKKKMFFWGGSKSPSPRHMDACKALRRVPGIQRALSRCLFHEKQGQETAIGQVLGREC